ncbi:MAG: pentapeptide repeat-containing protein [Candidatus Nanopelagicales bacterium]|nr:pentapeptide repeat-containing protein [Candidatus Nanopelagicales bacterium]MCF8536999.1 pentapeptide repeat-containing protein [Candidatus Nanopelagicales bacterium]MCF8542482.1 pentapeptide repeat-containing protein [Candidatus Nanopelagicales bacterium]MCF8556856.1 pentapeptide repeat-containing protein [Candidatus Nanopelagicales bacterium]
MKLTVLIAAVALTLTACSGSSEQALGLAGDEASPSTTPSETADTDAPDLNMETNEDIQVIDDLKVAEGNPPEMEVSEYRLPGEVDGAASRELCQLLESRRSQGIDPSILRDCFWGYGPRDGDRDICRRLDLADYTWDNQIESICGPQLPRVNGCVIREETSCVGADLSAAQLNNARLRRSNLARANLSGARLSRADMADADLRGADLTGADLSNVQLYGANLTGATLRGARISGTNFGNAIWTDGRQCSPVSSAGTCLITEVIDLARDLR